MNAKINIQDQQIKLAETMILHLGEIVITQYGPARKITLVTQGKKITANSKELASALWQMNVC